MPLPFKRSIGKLLRLLRLIKGPPPFQYPDDISNSVREAWESVRAKRLTYLTNARLASLVRLCQEMDRESIEGEIIEAGCALGGSAILLCATKQPSRRLEVYDVFDMIPPPSKRDGEDVHRRFNIIKSRKAKGIDGNPYYGYEENLFDKVTHSFESFGYPLDQNNAALIKGLVQDTMNGEGAVCLAHIDLDWHDPVMTCLERIVPRLSVGGAVVLDDYNDWSGCRTATDEYFDRVGRTAFEFDSTPGHLVVRRRA